MWDGLSASTGISISSLDPINTPALFPEGYHISLHSILANSPGWTFQLVRSPKREDRPDDSLLERAGDRSGKKAERT